MRFRKLRIAWSVVCGIFWLLLIMLWVRSYWIVDVLEKRTATQIFQLESQASRLSFWQKNPGTRNKLSPRVIKDILDAVEIGRFHSYRPVGSDRGAYWHQASVLAFGRFGKDHDRVIFIPYWFPVLNFAAITAVPLIP
jgi:hypothetical protein